MDPLLTLQLVRLAKLLSAFAFVAGAVGATVPGDIERQRIFAYRVAGPGFGLTWCFGILLMFLTGRSLFTTFILAGFVLSFITLHAVLYAAGREERRARWPLLTVVVTVTITVALMVFRP
ncbi:MAG: hypothetical protein R3B40_21135 [Polyangiales bacterium]|nr:hypothetical protein [Sandaracinaceae bacterium]